jgi:hypothetical protein
MRPRRACRDADLFKGHLSAIPRDADSYLVERSRHLFFNPARADLLAEADEWSCCNCRFPAAGTMLARLSEN